MSSILQNLIKMFYATCEYIIKDNVYMKNAVKQWHEYGSAKDM